MSQHENISCPLCGDKVEKLLFRYHIDNEKVIFAGKLIAAKDYCCLIYYS